MFMFGIAFSVPVGSPPSCVLLRFVSFLEHRGAADSGGMSQVLENLVQRFLNVERYANDIRYVKYCVAYVSLNSQPAASVLLMRAAAVTTEIAAPRCKCFALHPPQSGVSAGRVSHR